MFFVNTRDAKVLQNFTDVVLNAIPKQCEGIFVPSFLTPINDKEIITMSQRNYKDILTKLLLKVSDFNQSTIENLIDIAYKDFNRGFGGNSIKMQKNNKDIITVQTLEKNTKIINLTHGPTGNCKDYGYCLAASIVDYLARLENKIRIIIDISDYNSGPSTAWAIKDKSFLKGLILMNNSHNLANKALFSQAMASLQNIKYVNIDADFNHLNKVRYTVYSNISLREILNIAFINETNLACIFAYLPVFFKAYHECNYKPFCVSIPTNNMSIAMSAFFAKKLGVPIVKIILSTEKNNFLKQFQENKITIDNDKIIDGCTSFYSKIPINFERMLFYLYNANQSSVKRTMQEIESGRNYKMNDNFLSKFKSLFHIVQCDNQFMIRDVIHTMLKKNNLYIDQYFALAKIGINDAINKIPEEINDIQMVILNTMDFRRNIDFVETALGYNIELVEYPWCSNDTKLATTEIRQDINEIIHYIVNYFE